MHLQHQPIDIKAYLNDFHSVKNEGLIPDNISTRVEYLTLPEDGNRSFTVPKFINEFWTSRQRQANAIHEISYRACFKPQLPGFFIKLLTQPGDVVYDPFSGRGTTIIEAALVGRNIVSNDLNPLSKILCRPRLFVPELTSVGQRLETIPVKTIESPIDLSMFYHKDTLREILSLRRYLLEKENTGGEDVLDAWIRMVATNRLTGHSKGFFSVYTLPPNQAVSPENQIKINAKKNQRPGYRNTREIILKKTKDLIKNLTRDNIDLLKKIGEQAVFLTKDARETNEIPDGSVGLTVTSPPFLDVVQYTADNWLRCWFNHIDGDNVAKTLTMSKKIEDWCRVMDAVFKELYRITRSSGHVAFEVGEVRNGNIKLDEYVARIGVHRGFHCRGVMINEQRFTKTSNIWGISNNRKGTNSNRIVLFKKE